ncbi:MAG: 5,6-dimethylbenzimidazole synthase [Actinobacteria bacterium]|nr:5,6-dimethylbenzimidazole synthase [Actinomycetota bacterium]
MTWPRPTPLIGDQTSAAQRGAKPDGWRFPEEAVSALYDVVRARRDVRRFRPDAVPDEVLERVLGAAHAAPSVGHSQPWRFVVVDDPAVRERAAVMADVERLAQAAQLDPESARHLLDLQLEGIREAPLGVVVCCDRRTPAAGVLGRATFADADLWSCACAIENLWLAARAEGLGLGWVTLFQPNELAALLDVPPGVVTLGWLCLGWPDERAPAPGLERAGWSKRAPLRSVVLRNRWPGVERQPPAPPSRLRAPNPDAVVGARDDADTLLTALGSLGVLDRALDRATALGLAGLDTGTLVLAAGRHRVTDLAVSAFAAGVTDDVLDAARAGQALGVVAARAAGLDVQVVDAGSSTGNLRDEDALAANAVEVLLARGQEIGAQAARRGLVALGEVGVGNTTVAAALAASLLGCTPGEVIGLGSGADSDMVERKTAVVEAALARFGHLPPGPVARLAALGGPEFAFLTGVILGAARSGGLVVLDGLATSVCALVAMEAEPAVAAHLVAGQRSRERAHPAVLRQLGLEPLLDLRLRSGEGVGAVFASELVLMGLRIRSEGARTVAPEAAPG